MQHAHEVDDRDLDLRFSLGFYVSDDGALVADVVPGSPGDAAGLSSGDKLIAINGRKWSRDTARDALASGAHAQPGAVLTLLVEKDDVYKSVELHYAGGERFPQLVRITGTADVLADITRPRAATHR